jgi:hypothetical protein
VATANASYSIWCKPLPSDRLAVLVVSMARAGTVSLSLDLAKIAPALSCLKDTGSEEGDCTASDVWANKTAGIAVDGKFAVKALSPHDSKFLIFS